MIQDNYSLLPTFGTTAHTEPTASRTIVCSICVDSKRASHAMAAGFRTSAHSIHAVARTIEHVIHPSSRKSAHIIWRGSRISSWSHTIGTGYWTTYYAICTESRTTPLPPVQVLRQHSMPYVQATEHPPKLLLWALGICTC